MKTTLIFLISLSLFACNKTSQSRVATTPQESENTEQAANVASSQLSEANQIAEIRKLPKTKLCEEGNGHYLEELIKGTWEFDNEAYKLMGGTANVVVMTDIEFRKDSSVISAFPAGYVDCAHMAGWYSATIPDDAYGKTQSGFKFRVPFILGVKESVPNIIYGEKHVKAFRAGANPDTSIVLDYHNAVILGVPGFDLFGDKIFIGDQKYKDKELYPYKRKKTQ